MTGKNLLTDADIEKGWHATFSTSNPYRPCNLKTFTKAVRWAEAVLSRLPAASPKVADGISTAWVKCPVCGEPNMRKETDRDGNALIHCVNHGCRSNGGTAASEAGAVPVGCILVRQEDTEHYIHPQYGPGIFFTEDCILPANPPHPRTLEALALLEQTASEAWRIGERKTDAWDALASALVVARSVLKDAPPAPVEAGAVPVAWRHSKTLCLYETEEEVPLADGDEWAEPLYAAPPAPVAARMVPIAYADKIAFESAMAAGKGCDVWPKHGNGLRETVTLYIASSDAPAQQENDATIVKLWASGGQSRHHDYLMSDGTIRTLKDTETDAMRSPAPAAQQEPLRLADPIPADIAADLERNDWTPEEALRWYAAGKHYDTVNGHARILDNGGVASNALKRSNAAYHAEHGADASFPAPQQEPLNEQREIARTREEAIAMANRMAMARLTPADIDSARAALSKPATVAHDTDEGAEILRSLIDNIEADGLYSKESMLGFLNQAYFAIKPANPPEVDATVAQVCSTCSGMGQVYIGDSGVGEDGRMAAYDICPDCAGDGDATVAQGDELDEIADAFLWKLGTQHCLFHSLTRAMARREADGGEVIPLYRARAAMSAQPANGDGDA